MLDVIIKRQTFIPKGLTASAIQLELRKFSLTEKIFRLEDEMMKLPQVPCQIENIFLDGIYERRITLPAGTTITGAVHKTDYKIRLEKGIIDVLTDDGIKTLIAPCELTSKAGIKRVGYATTEVIWVDIYDNPDNCTDLNILVERLTTSKYDDLSENRLIIESQKDWNLFVANSGWNQEQIDSMVNTDDMIEMPSEFSDNYELKNSPIDGIGMFVKKSFFMDDLICPARINEHRTHAGRFINHSQHCNVKFVKLDNGDLIVVAKRFISSGEELLLDYRQAAMANIGKVIS